MSSNKDVGLFETFTLMETRVKVVYNLILKNKSSGSKRKSWYFLSRSIWLNNIWNYWGSIPITRLRWEWKDLEQQDNKVKAKLSCQNFWFTQWLKSFRICGKLKGFEVGQELGFSREGRVKVHMTKLGNQEMSFIIR